MENMENLQVFENPEFGKLTVLTIDGEPWFIGSEVAELLGYQLTRKSVWSHVDPMDKNTVPIRNGNKRGNPNKVIINESGLYSLVMRSKIKSARKFQRWVTSEVLPSILSNGFLCARKRRKNQADISCAMHMEKSQSPTIFGTMTSRTYIGSSTDGWKVKIGLNRSRGLSFRNHMRRRVDDG